MTDKTTVVINANVEPDTSKKLRAVISDAYAFVRSAEANRALATVSLEDLIGDQIKRNGDSDKSLAAQFDPYSYDPDAPASEETYEGANFLGAADTGRPSKLAFIEAIKRELSDVITQIKEMPPSEVAEAEEYTDAVEDSATE